MEPHSFRRFIGVLTNILGLIRTWRNRAAGRRQLSRVTDLDLKDIGLQRFEARREARKWFRQ